jgi:16S rRNA (adenine1518-N6/adenine1519-N6)-dimethyltransferase
MSHSTPPDDPLTLLQRYELWPRKSLGQNFLVDRSAPGKIADCAGITAADTVLEVGAGLGTLTAALALHAGRVIAVETDPQLVDILHTELLAYRNVEIVHGDILELDPAALLAGPGVVEAAANAGSAGADSGSPLWGPRLPHYHVVGNLPYYITNAVMRHLLEATVRPARMVVTVQSEVAQRMVAAPNDMSLLAVSIQFYGDARICLRLKRGAFHPVPQVDSAVVRLDLYDTPPVEVSEVDRFFRIVKAGFAQRRKQLRNSLSATLQLDAPTVEAALQAAGIDPRRRAETLTLKEWGRVDGALAPLLA